MPLTKEELQKIIDSKPKNWTKKDFRGEGKLNKKKLMGKKETERTTLKFYQHGRIYKRNMKNHFDNSTVESIEEFKKGEIDFLSKWRGHCRVFGGFWYQHESYCQYFCSSK